ncbi:hypothetical protein JQ595_16490 [Bradyrhizobium japonicum]|uniref:hypothetical protein n=1 Tax=Bradyrhizobium japonicum TaxID=375 RepID=UPI001BA68317|nr:hypothetical protein [Bradyrhizobium japonicum]MBR0730351.1 hypothetical protein [Bradyrhizobium japonicum]
MRQWYDKMLATAELEFRISLLPPISRGAHLSGPHLHAQRLVELWKVEAGNDVPLAHAFRLLDAEALAGAILRTLASGDYPNDPRYWLFPSLTDLLPELHALSWQAMLSGVLSVEAIKSLQGKRHRAVAPVELPRLTPDWDLSRLCQDERDEFLEVRVRRAPAGPVRKRWRKSPAKGDLKSAMGEIAKISPDGVGLDKVWNALKGYFPEITRQQAQNAIKAYAPQLKGRRGYRAKIKSPV